MERSGSRVAAGVPIAATEELGRVAARFQAESARLGLRVLFFSADQEFLDALGALEDPFDFDFVPIGEQPEWNPSAYHTDGPDRRSLRSQVRRARTKGVTVRRVEPDELASAPGRLRAEIEWVLSQWMAARRMSMMRFMVDLHPFAWPEERRYYVAEVGDRAVGFLAAIPVYRPGGWFFEDVIRVPDAPNGTVELMIDTAMRHAAEAGDAWVTLGLAPLAGVDGRPGPNRRIRRALQWCFEHLGGLYHFGGLRRFKQRFRPDVWRPQYLVACPGPVGLRAFHAVLAAFAGGGIVAFGLDTLRRILGLITRPAWAALLWVLAALLIPWTVLLAGADGARWFGDPSIQTAWVAFDASMVCALTALGRLVRLGRPSAGRLATFLAGATLTDFVLTTVQAFHLHHDLAGGPRLFLAAGICGPLLATIVLTALSTVYRPRPPT